MVVLLTSLIITRNRRGVLHGSRSIRVYVIPTAHLYGFRVQGLRAQQIMNGGFTHQPHHHQKQKGSPSWQQEHWGLCHPHCPFADLETPPAQQLLCLLRPQLWRRWQVRVRLRCGVGLPEGILRGASGGQMLEKLHAHTICC